MIRQRLEAERIELETLRKDLWFTVLHPEAVPVPEDWPDDVPEPIALDPEPSGCPACGSWAEPVPVGEVCGSCKARYPERVAAGACVGCGYAGEYPACARCEIPF